MWPAIHKACFLAKRSWSRMCHLIRNTVSFSRHLIDRWQWPLKKWLLFLICFLFSQYLYLSVVHTLFSAWDILLNLIYVCCSHNGRTGGVLGMDDRILKPTIADRHQTSQDNLTHPHTCWCGVDQPTRLTNLMQLGLVSWMWHCKHACPDERQWLECPFGNLVIQSKIFFFTSHVLLF